MQPAETQTIEQLPTPEVPVARQPNRLQWIFLGPNGLRAFWRLATFIGVVVGLRFGISGMLRLLHLVAAAKRHCFHCSEGVGSRWFSFPLCVGGTLIMGAFENARSATTGCPGMALWKAVFEGIVWGFLAEAGTVVVLFLTGNATFSGFAPPAQERFATPPSGP
jgi:hypothetical protein